MTLDPIPPQTPWLPEVRVVSSRQRRRTVSARMAEGGVLEVRVPHWMGEAERRQWVEKMRVRIERQLRRARPSDAGLELRAQQLNRRYFGGRLRWNSISFADQEKRWGSCSFTAGVIRIAHRAAKLPPFALDYLLIHELSHLEQADHGPAFWELVNSYPLTERARGYLMGLDHAAGRPDAAEAY